MVLFSMVSSQSRQNGYKRTKDPEEGFVEQSHIDFTLHKFDIRFVSRTLCDIRGSLFLLKDK